MPKRSSSRRFIRLHHSVRYCCRGDIRRGRAKWLVLNFIWSQLATVIQKRSSLREEFLYLASHEYRYASGCKPLYSNRSSVYVRHDVLSPTQKDGCWYIRRVIFLQA